MTDGCARAHVSTRRDTGSSVLGTLPIGLLRCAKFDRNRHSRSSDVGAAPCTCARAIWVPNDFRTAPYSPVSNRVPNLSAIGPAVIEIWKRPLNVRTCITSPSSTEKNSYTVSIQPHTKFHCNRSVRSRDMTEGCARARVSTFLGARHPSNRSIAMCQI